MASHNCPLLLRLFGPTAMRARQTRLLRRRGRGNDSCSRLYVSELISLAASLCTFCLPLTLPSPARQACERLLSEVDFQLKADASACVHFSSPFVALIDTCGLCSLPVSPFLPALVSSRPLACSSFFGSPFYVLGHSVLLHSLSLPHPPHTLLLGRHLSTEADGCSLFPAGSPYAHSKQAVWLRKHNLVLALLLESDENLAMGSLHLRRLAQTLSGAVRGIEVNPEVCCAEHCL